MLAFGWFYYKSELARQHELDAWQAPRPDQDLTHGSDGVCEIHRVKMERRRVEIRYGLGADTSWYVPKVKHAGSFEKFWALAKARFPHALDQAFGGCVITPSSPSKAVIYVCPECAHDLMTWQQEKRF